jgi:hypothetical protein
MWTRIKKFLKKLDYVLSNDTTSQATTVEIAAIQPTMRTCIHEAGHYMVARLFPGNIRINILSANRDNLFDDMNGALHITRIGPETLNSCDQLMLTAAGGLAANTISLRGKSYVVKHLSRFPLNTEGLDLDGTIGDYDLIQTCAMKISNDWGLNQEGYVRVQWNAIQSVFCYLMEDAVWKAVQILAQDLYDNQQNTLTPTQAEQILLHHNLSPELDSLKIVYLAHRYPLTAMKQATLI